MRRVLAGTTAAALAAVAVTGLPGAAAAAPSVTVSKACFTATGPDGRNHPIAGRRFVVGAPKPTTPVLVLVHGVASDHGIWDASPTRSVARGLAAEGYVVIAYDRLGFGDSRYTGKGGGAALTVAVQQAVLHDLVGQVHRGTYRVGRPAGACGRTARIRRTGLRSSRVAVLGHSAGGFIVSSYPGRFHDVVATVQVSAPSGVSSEDPEGNAAVVSVTAPPFRGGMTAQFGPIGDPARDGRPRKAPVGSRIDNPTRAACEDFNFWRPGAVAALATRFCDPARAIPTPTGEGDSLAAQAGTNQGLIRRTGDTPVLLVQGDHDSIMRANAAELELSGWQETCGCSVEQRILPDTGHAFMFHRSLPTFLDEVTEWLAAKHLPGTT